MQNRWSVGDAVALTLEDDAEVGSRSWRRDLDSFIPMARSSMYSTVSPASGGRTRPAAVRLELVSLRNSLGCRRRDTGVERPGSGCRWIPHGETGRLVPPTQKPGTRPGLSLSRPLLVRRVLLDGVRNGRGLLMRLLRSSHMEVVALKSVGLAGRMCSRMCRGWVQMVRAPVRSTGPTPTLAFADGGSAIRSAGRPWGRGPVLVVAQHWEQLV